MENITNLQDLMNKANSAKQTFRANAEETIRVLSEFIKKNCVPEGIESVVDLSFGDTWNWEVDGRYEFRGRICFLDESGKRDFGSDISIVVFEKGGIQVNYGSIGSYRSSDKYQLARLNTLVSLFANEELLVNLMNETFNFDLFAESRKYERDISRLENELIKLERSRKEEEVRAKLKAGMYLYQETKSSMYDADFNKVIAKVYIPVNVLKIEKVTEKTVIAIEGNYRWINKHLKLQWVIDSLISGGLLISESEPERREEPIE